MITTVRHTGIVVQDLDAALHFYCMLLGFHVVRQMRESGAYIENALSLPGVQVTTTKLAIDDHAQIELLYFHDVPGQPNHKRLFDFGLTHIALQVKELDQDYERLSKLGVEFLSTPQYAPNGLAKVAFCKAPDNVFLELVELLA